MHQNHLDICIDRFAPQYGEAAADALGTVAVVAAVGLYGAGSFYA